MSGQTKPDAAGGGKESRLPQPVPAEPAEEVTRPVPAPSAGEKPRPASGKTILVVQNDPDTAEGIKVRLEAQGYKVVTVHDGLHALETARRIEPDLVILSIMLPGLMGHHVCRLLKFDERYRKIPIIMLTGKSDEDSREMGMKAGADRYIIKPFEMSELIEEVEWYAGAK